MGWWGRWALQDTINGRLQAQIDHLKGEQERLTRILESVGRVLVAHDLAEWEPPRHTDGGWKPRFKG